MHVFEFVTKRALSKRMYYYNKQSNYSLQQNSTLKKLLSKAKNTEFGKFYHFEEILKSSDIKKAFQKYVPVFDYETMYAQWWHKLLAGQSNITWPGKVKKFGLTSGTSNDSSKRVPVTSEMVKAIHKTGIRQLCVLADVELPPKFYKKQILLLGGSTELVKLENYYEGDLSGILTGKLPSWFNRMYKPGEHISKERDWNVKLDKIVQAAADWDIVIIAGVPAWVQMLLERIIAYYKVSSIHDIWPNLTVYSHGGVSFEPYKKSFSKLLGKEIYFMETYLASEGFLAYQPSKNSKMKLVMDNGIYFEFVPFTLDNFDSEGNLKENAEVLLLEEVEANVNYAIIISTVSGTWRYLIGDTIQFTSTTNYEIIITGRTKHFLSLCGEHLSVDNMNKAIEILSNELDVEINEFTVAGIPYDNLFAHKWYLGISNPSIVNIEVIKEKLDSTLKRINDDYAVERKAALKEIFVEVLPNELFHDWMKIKGKIGGQSKFPRVLNGSYNDWENFLCDYKLQNNQKTLANTL